jgi:small GTP-binding protein
LLRIGAPASGKSTLINAIVGQKLSIVTYKPQTTRHRVVGIASDKEYQMILFDTPGGWPNAEGGALGGQQTTLSSNSTTTGQQTPVSSNSTTIGGIVASGYFHR